jgi:hypothetical protein
MPLSLSAFADLDVRILVEAADAATSLDDVKIVR